MVGTLFGVGVGPGDPELITLKAVKVIQQADIIITPTTEINKNSLALSIIQDYISSSTEVIEQYFPMNYDKEELTGAHQLNKNEIVSLLDFGKKVVYITLGDPMLYSTFIYIFNLLKDTQYPIEIIPGITSFCDCASRSKMPLAVGKEILRIVPATNKIEELDKAIQSNDNLVLMKVYRNLDEISKKLIDSGYQNQSVLISRSGLKDEKIYYDLSQLDDQQKEYLSTIIAKRDKKIAPI